MLILKEEWQRHPKILKAVYLARSKQVKHFWFELISDSANGRTDGVIELFRISDVADSCGIDLDTADRFVQALLTCSVGERGAGLLHDKASLSKCDACKDELRKAGRRPGPDDLVVHDFLKHNPAARDKTPLGQARQKRKNWLNRNGKGLKLEVYQRDQGLCRYCGCRPVEDGDGPTALEHDHVDPNPMLTPNLGNFPDNLVIACRSCNARKGQRTPAEAGMQLLAPGTTRQDVLDGRAFYVSTPSELPPPAPDPTGVRDGSGTVQGPVRAGSGLGQDRSGAGGPSTTRSTSIRGPKRGSTPPKPPKPKPP